jgi:DnaJ-domain-containing protein 1
MDNFFSFFNLKPSVFVDLNLLEDAYHKIQKLVHPDNQKDPLHLNAAMALSQKAAIAYDTLKKPLLCVDHLLQLQNLKPIKESNLSTTDPLLLNDILMYQEQLMDDSLDKESFVKDIDVTLRSVGSMIDDAFNKNDVALLEKTAHRFFYLSRIKERVENQIYLTNLTL